jgi:UDP-xylose:glucoside alpha-1,3-xylosyltransferase
MLMNLTRMRVARWLDDIIEHYNKYRYDITWGDQDLINIYFHFYPGYFAFPLPLHLYCFMYG